MPFDKLIELSSGDVEVAIEKLIEISMVADGNIQGYFFKLTDLLFICFKPMLTEYRETYQVKQKRFLLANKVHSQVFQIDDLGYSFSQKIKETNNETSNRLRSSPHLQQSIDTATNMSFTVAAEDASFLFIETYQLQPAADKMEKLASEFHQVKDLDFSRTSSGGSMSRPRTTSTQSGHSKTRSRVADFEKMDSFAIVPSFLRSDEPTGPQQMGTPRETFVPGLRKPSEQTTQLSFDNMLAAIDDEPKMETAAPGLQWSTLDAPVQVPLHKSEQLGVSISETAPVRIGKRQSMVVEERPTSTSRPGTADLDLNTDPEAILTATATLTPEDSTIAESVLVQAPVKSSPLQEGELLPTKTPKPVQDRLSECQGSHLVVFVHGYEGCSFDMKTLKNLFCYTAKPHVVCHCATANETDSTIDIEAQGGLLAEEVLELVKFNFSPDGGAQSQVLQKISFVGHSLGGLVIRAALPRLASLASKMHALLTFGTPHLGCSNGNSTLIKTGFKVFTRIMGHKSLNQMNLTDASEIKNTFLMKARPLTQGIEWFSHVILFSSYQDLYVPSESARIEYGDIEQRDKKRSHYFKRMVQNLTGRLRDGRLVRVDMNVKQSGTLNNLTGRQAHIKILDTLELQALVVYTFGEYLD